MIFLDVETDGLNATKIWMAVTRCATSSEVVVHWSAETLIEVLNKADKIIGHNLIGFDVPVLKFLWGVDIPEEKVIDTLVLSRLLDPQLKGHSLEKWGERLGFPKGDHSEWHQYSKEMEEYCIRDTEVNQKTYEHLIAALERIGCSKQAIEMEHKVQFIIQQQVRNGWKFNEEKAYCLLAELREKLFDLEDEVRQTFKPLATYVKEVKPKIKKDGSTSIVGLKFLGDSWTTVEGPFSRIDFPPFNLGSRQQIGRYLEFFGWKPDKFTETGQPVVDEKVLSGIKNIPEALLISDYLMVQKRIAQVQSWVDALSITTGRVHGKVNPCGTLTYRMSHSKPNLAQVPAGYSPYGEQCRELWTVEKGYKLVGCDAKALELRILASYMEDEEFKHEVVEGDIHSTIKEILGFERRDTAKVWLYALIYGASDGRLASIFGGDYQTSTRIRERFESHFKSFGDLKEAVNSRYAGDDLSSDLTGLDGRKMQPRYDHTRLNTLIQSGGAIVMKQALIILKEYANMRNYDYKFVGNIHDEIQAEVLESQAESFGRLAVDSIQAAGMHFNLFCPLTGDYKIGDNWYETH